MNSGIDFEMMFSNTPLTVEGYCRMSKQNPNQSMEEYEELSKEGCRVDCRVKYGRDRHWNEVESICVSALANVIQVFPDGMDCTDDIYGNGTCMAGVCIRTVCFSLYSPLPIFLHYMSSSTNSLRHL